MQLEDRVLAEIDRTRDAGLDWLRRCVQIPSVTGEEGAAQAFVVETLRELGAELDIWDVDREAIRGHRGYSATPGDYAGRPNVVGRLAGSGGGRSLLFNGHVDVVPIEDPTLWRYDPWSGAVADGRMYGRGTSDMKAGFAGMVWAARALRATGVRLRGDLVLESTVEEEAGGNGALAAVLRGHTADGAVVGEPTSMGLVPAHEGVLWFRVTVAGVSAHGGYRTKGVSAIEKAMQVYWALRQHETDRNREITTPLFAHLDVPAPISVGVFLAGHWPATVPDAAVMQGRAAVRLGETVDEAAAAFTAAVERAAKDDPFLREHPPRIEFDGARMDSCQIELDHPLAQAATDILGRLNPGFRVWAKAPATDMRHLMLYGGTPTVIVGPGDDELAHVANESVSVDLVVQAAKFYALLALEWCG